MLERLHILALNKTCKITVLLALLLIMSLLSLQAQDTTLVNGIILSYTNQPIEEVTVSIDGSSELPVVSDSKGEFTVKSTSVDDWIIISPTGRYKQKRIFLNNRSRLIIYLSADDIPSGEDNLLILSQQVAKRDLISSFNELDIEDIHHSNVLSIDQFMQGRIPGMNVINRSGSPGSGAFTAMRGINSLHASNMPLYLIDGIPLSSHGIFGSNLSGYVYNPLMGLNLSDISRIAVIKDQSFSAAYGSKASNGLIIIETLDPSVTQTTIDVNLKTGYLLAPSNQIPQRNGGQHKTLMNEVLFTSGYFEEEIREIIPNLFLDKDEEGYINYLHNTNWQDQILTNSSMYNLNMMVKGGDEIARYGLSFGYLSSKGIIKETGFQGYNLRFVSRLNIFTWLKMDATVSLSKNSTNLKEAANVKETSPVMASLAKSPLLNPYQYDLEGNELSTLAEVDELGISNPVAIIDNFEAANSNHNFTSALGFETTINDHLKVNSKFSINYDVQKEQIFLPNHGMERYYNYEAFNVSKATNNSLTSLYNNTYLSYNRLINKKHRISSSTGMNMHTNNYELDWGITKNAHANDEFRMLQDGQHNLREIGGGIRRWNWISLYENIIYTYNDKYLLTANLSFDGSSRLGDNADNAISLGNVPFGVFYSGGIAWRISNESFLKNTSWLEDLKLRITAGKSGNDDIGEASSSKYYEAVRFRETVGLYPAVIANDRLTYEAVSQINAGIDVALLGNRAGASVDLFRSLSKNMIILRPVETYIGYDYRIENGGEMSNRGWEFNIFVRIIDRNSFKWDFQANISHVKNEILDIRGDKLIYDVDGAEKVNVVGSPVYSFYGYRFKGVYSSYDEASSAELLNEKMIPYLAGDAIFEDISGPADEPDGIINDFDKTTIGSAIPDYFGGINNTFHFKNWSLSTFIQFVSGNEVFNYVRYQNESMSDLSNQSSRVASRWQYDGQVTEVPRAMANDPIGNSDFSTRWIEDGSYLRLKQISLSYRIPDKFLLFNNAEFYISANNIITLTKYLGYDPEFSYSLMPIHQGIDYGMTPQCRQFIAGVRIGL